MKTPAAKALGRSTGFIVIALMLAMSLRSQEVDLKQKAVDEFESENYSEAVSLLKQSLTKSPNDREIYFCLGYFTHYLCYDSVPLTSYGREKSDEILEFLQRAIALDPKFGDAYYFIGARSREAMRQGDTEGMIAEMRAGREKLITCGIDWMRQGDK